MAVHPVRVAWLLGAALGISQAEEQYFPFLAQSVSEITTRSLDRVKAVILITSGEVKCYEYDPDNTDPEDGVNVIFDSDDRPFVLRAIGATVSDASESVAGVVKLASTTTAQAGTDTARALTAAGLRASTREKLLADRTYYVRDDGDDTNNGFTNTAGGAFLTKQKAYDTVVTLDFNGYTVTIKVADGTYTGRLSIAVPWIGGLLIVEGNTTTPGNCLINSSSTCFDVSATLPSIPIIKGFKVQSSAANGVSMTGVGRLDLSKVNFGACASIKMYASGGYARIHIQDSYTDEGNAIRHFSADHGAYISLSSGKTITINSSPTYSGPFAYANDRAALSLIGASFSPSSGAFTGQRFQASEGGHIQTGGQASTWIPGSVAGTGTNFGASPYGRYS